MPNVDYTRYYGVAELDATLREFVGEYPHLITLESIGKSYEGRDLWLATLTNHNTGAAADKPGFWVDANIHAT